MKRATKFVLAVLLCIIPFTLLAQKKKPYTFEDAMRFKLIRETSLSQNGKWLAYTLVPDRGDRTLYIQSLEDTIKFTYENGSKPKLSPKTDWAAFEILPKQIEIENAGKKDKPKNKFGIMNLANGRIVERETVKSFEFSNDGKWLAFLYEGSDEKDKKLKDKIVGSQLNLRHLQSGTEIRIDYVIDFLFDSLSNYVFYSISTKSGNGDGLYYRNLDEDFAPEYEIISKNNIHICNLAWKESVQKLAFCLATLDNNGKAKDYSIYIWDKAKSSEIVTPKIITSNYYIPQVNDISWSGDGSKLFFGIKPITEKYDTKQDFSNYNDTTFFNIDSIARRADLSLWHWDDPLIMSHQKISWNKFKDRYFLSVFDLRKNSFIQLGDSTVNRVFVPKNNNVTIAYSETPYYKERTWYGDLFDLYLVNLDNGEKKIIQRRIEENAYLSPNGKYVVYYNQKNWYLYDVPNNITRNITENLDGKFFDIEFDMPSNIPSNGFGCWLDSGNAFVIYDWYDLWKFDCASGSGYNLTNQAGKKEKVSFRIRNIWAEKDYYLETDTLILQGYNNYTKVQGIYTFILKNKELRTNLLETEKKFTIIGKPRYNNKILYTRENYVEYPDYWITSNLNFTDKRKITDANPEIVEYEWGTTEIIRWVNSRGDSLDGFIIKPYNYNPKKRYPIYVYFYERFSDRTYNFNPPMLSHRPIPQVYNSSGYIMFLPDIKYYIGNPGFDALDAIITGSRRLIELGIADSSKFCIQGHSWSGYQTAFIATQTDFFKAACAGAPVGNMTSAYGQIRLESGLTRQFQYEAQQSRIGGTLWDSLDNYIRNSPIFNVNKATTPLLIMFGDIDEAVPWQQGIELYMAYRRLGKNAIFLQYENEPHHPRRYQNKLDYSIKMKEFFDHYVLGKPAPVWIIKGMPYKGN
ncbi:MAG: prolyl oligopeptidase family serine peptidase [Bacteroidota bacterium]